ncbi:hypothetical protein Tco_0559620 [Tanacetum coccineum]
MASNDPILTTMRFIPQHEVVQKYGAILPDNLTTQAMKEFEAYKTYYAFATRKAIPKPKYVRRPTKEKTEQAPKPLPVKESKLLLRSKTHIHNSQPSGLGAHEGTGVKLRVPDVPTYESDDEKISWKSSDEEDYDDVVMSDDADDNDDQNDDDTDNEDDDNQNDDNADNEKGQDDEDKEEEWSDDEAYDNENQGANVEGEELDEADELYRDVNVNLDGRDTEMIDAPHTIVQTTQVIEDTHMIITLVNPEGQKHSSSVSSGFVSNMLNPSPDIGIDSIFNLNTESTSLVDVPVTTIDETPLSSVTTLPPPPIPLITHLQQTPVPTPTTVPSSSLHDLPNFAVSLIPSIVDTYLANKMNKAVKIAVQLQSNRLRDEAQVENGDFINKLHDNIKKIIKEQVKEQVKVQVSKILPKIEKTVNEQLKAEVLTHSSNKFKTSHVVAANVSKLELKKILIDKIEKNKSIHRSDKQKNLYKALVDAYKSDKLILDTYGDTLLFKRRRDDEDKDEEPSVGSNRGSKRKRAGKEPELTSAPKEKTSKIIGKSTEGSKSHHESADKSAQVEEPMHNVKDLEEPAHQEFKEDTGDSFDELMDTPLDFSVFVMNRLKVDTLTPELLAGPTFELMKGSCKSLVGLEYFLEEV